MDKRTILAVVLSLAVLFIYQIYFAKPPAPPTTVPIQEAKKVAPVNTAEKPQLHLYRIRL